MSGFPLFEVSRLSYVYQNDLKTIRLYLFVIQIIILFIFSNINFSNIYFGCSFQIIILFIFQIFILFIFQILIFIIYSNTYFIYFSNIYFIYLSNTYFYYLVKYFFSLLFKYLFYSNTYLFKCFLNSNTHFIQILFLVLY